LLYLASKIKEKEIGMEEKSGIGYFLLGLGIGVAAGILWAPKSGEETRQLIADRAGEGADYLRARTEEGKQYVSQRASEGKEYLRQQTENLKGTASDLYEQSRSSVAKQKENLSAAVEAGKQAYRDAVSDVKSAAATASGSTSNPENV
jgi:gas vesicle protein